MKQMNEFEKLMETVKSFGKDAKYTFGEMDELKEWDSLGDITRNVGLLSELCGRAALVVEQAIVTTGIIVTSEEKRKAAAKVVDDWVELPGYLELFDGLAIEAAFAFAVGLLNQQFGDKWPKVV